MRKLLMTALLAATVAASAFAKAPKNVNTAVMNNFKVEFKKAADVKWTSTDQFVKATFTLDDERMEAFYNTNGEKIATSRAISINELPLNAKREFAKKFQGYTVKEAIEMEGIEENAYYISAENETESVILKVNSLNGLSTYSKTKK